MSKPARVGSSRNTFRGILLLGLSATATAPALALEPTPVNDPITSRLSVHRRTDANVQKDMAAAKAFRDKQIAEETKSSISFSAPPLEPESKPAETASSPADTSSTIKEKSNQADLPKYNSGGIKTPKADDAATTPPTLGNSGKSSAGDRAKSSDSTTKNTLEVPERSTSPLSSSVTSEALIESIDDCGNIVLTPAICVDEVVASRPNTVIQSNKPVQTVPAATDKDRWSEKNLVDKISQISGGAFEIDAVEQKQPASQIVTSGYRYVAQSDSQPATALPIIDTPLPSRPIESQSVITMRPISYLVGYAQDSAAATAPTLSSDSAVVPAAYQGGINLPAEPPSVLPNNGASTAAPLESPLNSVQTPTYSTPNPGLAIPSQSFSTNPSATTPPSLGPGTIVTPLGSGTRQSLPGSPLSPTHQPYDALPQGTLPATTGEPWVTPGPCQFDAYQMVTPVSYNAVQNTAPNYCSPWPTAAAPALTGTYPQAAAPGVSLPGFYQPTSIAMPTAYGTQYSNNGVAFKPLLDFGQSKYPYQVGRGLIGQPVAYIPGQRFRNFFRYFFP